ncbi:VOC family protein [Jeongeupia naejangsanensis]|uniref:Glyoxalase/bleomycin resistance/extradiol dioxygenase family protein n=1 Tax=Jeongeupia naejangsanensis TaxID=613195 RepID=A0ABS2BN16_9NEIS|nr:VOC family protein [Jeongeupia naejangsanensis]MBM3117007.1 glyoxalase/bleomycin resistance/extradiol dioxygenase family protein [Jeongeupia naejangsanensis]
MAQLVFINLAVDNLERSKTFFAALGYTFNEQFTDENAACMVISDTIYVMLLVKPFFQNFTDKALIDAHTHVETLTCLSCENRAEVDALVAKAVAAGGKTPREPKDYGFMYSHGFEDLDGHIWELMYMDPAHVQQ